MWAKKHLLVQQIPQEECRSHAILREHHPLYWNILAHPFAVCLRIVSWELSGMPSVLGVFAWHASPVRLNPDESGRMANQDQKSFLYFFHTNAHNLCHQQPQKNTKSFFAYLFLHFLFSLLFLRKCRNSFVYQMLNDIVSHFLDSRRPSYLLTMGMVHSFLPFTSAFFSLSFRCKYFNKDSTRRSKVSKKDIVTLMLNLCREGQGWQNQDLAAFIS